MAIATELERSFFKKAMEAPMLEAEHEFDLARRWREGQDEAALHELTSAYMRLVISTANKFRTYGLPLGDLVQEGNVGLMQAAARFEPDRGVRFSTYATWWIRSSIQDYVLRNWSIVRIGATVAHKALFFSLRRLRARIDDHDEQLGPKSRASIAKSLRVREVDVEHMSARLSGADRSLNAPLSDDNEGQLQDLLPSAALSPEDAVMKDLDAAALGDVLRKALAILTERERLIISARKLADQPETLESIGLRIGVSKERVRQIEQQALLRLREEVQAIVGDAREFGLLT